VRDAVALPLAATVWGTVIFQQSATDLSPDYLAAALAMTAATIAVGTDTSGSPARQYAVAVTLFVAAAFAQITAAAFVVPVIVTFWRASRRRDALMFAAMAAAALFAALAALDAVTAGVFHASFLATATGGMTAADVWHAAPKFVRELAIKPFDV